MTPSRAVEQSAEVKPAAASRFRPRPASTAARRGLPTTLLPNWLHPALVLRLVGKWLVGRLRSPAAFLPAEVLPAPPGIAASTRNPCSFRCLSALLVKHTLPAKKGWKYYIGRN